jgi:hypothetical protein
MRTRHAVATASNRPLFAFYRLRSFIMAFHSTSELALECVVIFLSFGLRVPFGFHSLSQSRLEVFGRVEGQTFYPWNLIKAKKLTLFASLHLL